MRMSRDMKNADIERFQNEVQELNQRFQIMQAENLQLEGQVAIQNNTMGKLLSYRYWRKVSESLSSKERSLF